MALPGLGDDIPEVEEQDEVIRDLDPSTEWRFEVAWTETIDVKLISGNAEIFGTELAPQHGYRFRGVKGAIYTETGCRLVTRGLLQSDYIFEDTTMVQYQNLHFALQKIRDQGERGPNVLIMGSADSGKTSLAKLLTAYSLRSSDGCILSVNVDPKNGMLAPPGTLSATVMESIVDPETVSGWGSAPSNGPMPVPVKLPLVYYYGLEDPSKDEVGYKSLLSKLALSVNGRIAEEATVRRAGVIIDSPSGLGVGNLSGLAEHIVSEFSVTVIVVIGNERLFGDMKRRFPSLQIVKVDKSGGAVEKDSAYNRRAREEEVHEYFYGDSRVSLNPHSSTMEWSDLAIFKIAASDSTAVETSFLPGGGADIREEEKPALDLVVEPTPELQGAILAVVNSDTSAAPYDIRSAPVIGFVHVSQVDDLKKRLKVLAPMSGRLPRKTLLWGTWPEHMEMDNTSLR